MAITNLIDDLGEVWMVEEHYEVLPKAVVGYDEHSLLLEIGTWKGRSAILFLQSNPKIKLYCLDIWHKAFDIFQDNLKWYGVGNRAIPIKNWSMNVHKYFAKKSLDFVYLDGSHKEMDVYNDLINLRRLLKDSGVVLGDDWQKKPIRSAVNRAVSEGLYQPVKSNTYTFSLSPK